MNNTCRRIFFLIALLSGLSFVHGQCDETIHISADKFSCNPSPKATYPVSRGTYTLTYKSGSTKNHPNGSYNNQGEGLCGNFDSHVVRFALASDPSGTNRMAPGSWEGFATSEEAESASVGRSVTFTVTEDTDTLWVWYQDVGDDNSGGITYTVTSSNSPSNGPSGTGGSSGPGGPGSCQPGLGGEGGAGINHLIGLGSEAFGDNVGFLAIRDATSSADLAKPSGMKINVNSSTDIHEHNGRRQAYSAKQGLVDLKPVDDYKYEIRFFKDGDKGNFDGNVYQPSLSNAFRTITVENPNGAVDFDTLEISDTVDGNAVTYKYTYDSISDVWKYRLNNALKERLEKGTDVNNDRTETKKFYDSLGGVIEESVQTYHSYVWGEEVIKVAKDPSDENVWIEYDYYTDNTNEKSYGHVKQIKHSNGYWEYYTYNEAYNPDIKQQYLDSAFNSADNLNRVTTTSSTGKGSVSDPKITTTVVKLKGQEISRTFTYEADDERRDIIAVEAGATWDDVDNIVTKTHLVASGEFVDEPELIEYPDGTVEVFQYSISGGVRTETVYRGEPNTNTPIDGIVDGTKTETKIDELGYTTSYKVWDYASNILIESEVVTQTDSDGRPTEMTYLDGETTSMTYGEFGPLTETDKDGVVTTYTYYADGNMKTSERHGITTHYEYDAAGNQTEVKREGTDTTEIVQSSSTYNEAGQLESVDDALSNTTSFSETIDVHGHVVKTTTLPGGLTRIETYYPDGQLYKIGGSAAYPVRYEYDVESYLGENCVTTKEIRIDKDSNETEWTKTWVDMAGNTVKVEYAAATTPYPATTYEYNSKNQLIQMTDPDGVITLYGYNDLGEQVVTAVDMNQDGTIDYSGIDRITERETTYTTAHSTDVIKTTTKVWKTDNVDSSTVISTTEVSADGLQSWTTINGAETHTQMVYGVSGARTLTTTAPDGTEVVQTYQDGRLESVVQNDNNSLQISKVSYGYDAHGRQSTITDDRNGTTTLTYYDNDQVKTQETPDPDGAGTESAQTTTFHYNALGQRTKTVLPDTTEVHYEYADTGELKKQYGSRTYPVEYTYDLGRMITMKTYKDYAGTSGDATTTWAYDDYRGYLNSKTYADGKGTSYTYTDAGRLKTRTWARGVTTTYDFDESGALDSVDYSDSTLDLSYTFNRLGQVKTVSDSLGTHTMTYNDAGQMLTDTLSGGGVLDGMILTNSFNAHLKRDGVKFQFGAAAAVTDISFTYGDSGRLEKVSNSTHSSTYAYHTDSNRINTITHKSGANTRAVATHGYDFLNRLSSIETKDDGTTVLSKHAYEYNTANQRDKVTLADGSYWSYGYDSLGQVTAGQKFLSNDTAVAGQNFGYNFDDIGNRKNSTRNGRNSTYASNDVNQYYFHTVPGAVDVLGTANASATVTVNNKATTRQADYWYTSLSVDNSSSGVLASYDATGIRTDIGPNGVKTTESGEVFVPKTPEVFIYDADGNLTSDGRWSYTWNAENRLVTQETHPSVQTVVDREKLEYTYDYQGRRVIKQLYTHDGSSYNLAEQTHYVYDGWNLLAELDGLNMNAVIRSYMWGLDLSGSEQGAGGVGGLLAMTDSSDTYFYAYDGNGNVTALISATDSSVVNSYDYGPFGENLAVDEGVVNPYRFSTKYRDGETGLYYYGYRYYVAETGRWLNRDPIGENGGLNIYSMVGNEPNNYIDVLGLATPGSLINFPSVRRAWANLKKAEAKAEFNRIWIQNKKNLYKKMLFYCAKVKKDCKDCTTDDCKKESKAFVDDYMDRVKRVVYAEIDKFGNVLGQYPGNRRFERLYPVESQTEYDPYSGAGLKCFGWAELAYSSMQQSIKSVRKETNSKCIQGYWQNVELPEYDDQHNFLRIIFPCSGQTGSSGGIIIDPWTSGGYEISPLGSELDSTYDGPYNWNQQAIFGN